MMPVMFIIVKSIESSYIPIDFLYKQLGKNIPRFCVIEDSDFHNPEYVFCIDAQVDFLDITQEFGYRCIHVSLAEIEEEKYNDQHIVSLNTDDIFSRYELVKYNREFK